MKIERIPAQFEPIVITLQSQDDVNALFNMAILAGEHADAESSGTYQYATKVAEALQDHITTDETVEEEQFEEDEETIQTAE